MSRAPPGTYQPLAGTLRQGGNIVTESAPVMGENLQAFNMAALPTEPRRRRSSRPQTSSPLLNSAPAPEYIPSNHSRHGSTQDRLPSRDHSQDPFITRPFHSALPLDPSDAQPRTFNFEKQLRRLILHGSLRFFMTFSLAGSFMGTIKVFSRDQVMSHDTKLWFNAISIGLLMALGMSVVEAFKRMAVDIRWWILSRKKRNLSEVDKILRADSLIVLLQLATTVTWRNIRDRHLFHDCGLILGITIWILVNVAAQVAIASVGLTYSPDPKSPVAQTTQGFVLLPNMTQIFPPPPSVGMGTQVHDSKGAQQFTANSYGNMALILVSDSASNIPASGMLWSTSPADFFWSDDGRTWTFVFIDSSPSDPGYGGYPGGPSAIFTNRTINSTYSCSSFAVIEGGNGTVTNLTVQEDTNGDLFNVSLPTVAGVDSTMYFTNPDTSCGDGCSIVEAFEASSTTSYYYNCNITVGTIMNATRPEHKVGIQLREMASAGIALQGYGPGANLPGSKQFQVYPSESTYGSPHSGNTDGIGSTISMFAIGVVSVAAFYNPNTFNVSGLQPQRGNQLTVNHWDWIWMIMGLIVGVQGAAFVLTAFLANRVVVKDESVFATARLLRPVLDRLGNEGTTMEGNEICHRLDPGQERRFIYTVPIVRDEPYRVELGDLPRMRSFPDGHYN